MLDILDVINDATKEANSFENHAAKNLTLEERLLYLQGLALVMNADGEIHPEEKEYIRILIKSFDMDEAILESFVEFAQLPDKDTVQAFFRTFRRRSIAQLFLFDALMMIHRDDNVDEKEKLVVDKIAEQLEVLKGTYHDVFDLFCHIKNKDWDDSSIYFSSYRLDINYFKHILSYFEVNLDDIIDKNKSKRKSRFREIMKKSEKSSCLVWDAIEYGEGIETTELEISKNSVNISEILTCSDWIPLFQSLLNRGFLRECKGSLYYEKEDLVLKIDSYVDFGIEFSKENSTFYQSYQNTNEVKISKQMLALIVLGLKEFNLIDSLLDFVTMIIRMSFSNADLIRFYDCGNGEYPFKPPKSSGDSWHLFVLHGESGVEELVIDTKGTPVTSSWKFHINEEEHYFRNEKETCNLNINFIESEGLLESCAGLLNHKLSLVR